MMTKKTEKIVNDVKNEMRHKRKKYKVSFPVLYAVNTKIFYAFFISFYKEQEKIINSINRPELWMLVDTDTGRITSCFNAKEYDFSDASFEQNYKFDFREEDEKENKKIYEEMDEIMKNYEKTMVIDEEGYNKYLKKVLKRTPEDYKRFYLDLSM